MKRNEYIIRLVAVTALLIVAMTRGAHAQGSIFGTVANADASHPGSGELFWVGFLDGTDEEIRIESCTGAGYDGLNWFDDFQNYTTEAAGNAYEFRYINTVNGEAATLAGAIPVNSFQQEDITLATAASPSRPIGLTATVVSPTTVDLTWHAQPGLRYRVYRRIATNNSTYRRLDDPSGNLATVGVAAPPFTDATSDGASLYSYIIIAEDSLGRWSAHSAEAVVDASGPACACDTHGDPSGDGVVNVLDVVALINVAFRGGTDIPDPNSNCPVTTTDCDCSGLTNVIDAVRMVEVAFRGGDAAAEFCDPCAP